MNFNPLSLLSNLGAVKNAAPKVLGGFLDKLLEENRPLLKPDEGEKQIFYIMFPKKDKYYISIVAADERDTIVRSLKTIPLDEALTTIFSEIND